MRKNNNSFEMEAIKLKKSLNNESRLALDKILGEYKKVIDDFKNYLTEEVINRMKRDIAIFFDKNYNVTTIFNLEKFQNDLEDTMENVKENLEILKNLEQKSQSLERISSDFDEKLGEYEEEAISEKRVENYANFIEKRIEEESSKNKKVKIDKKVLEWLKENLELYEMDDFGTENLSIGRKMEEIQELFDSTSTWDKFKAVGKALFMVANLKNEFLDTFDEIRGLLREKFEKINNKIEIFINCY